MKHKQCFKCNEHKPLSDFYKHKRMADGHLNKCKECTKRDVKRRYDSEPEKLAAYERKRLKDPARKAKAIEYQRTRRAKHPEKARARQMVAYHLRVGNITKKPCEICKDPDTQAHHEDYSKPLDVEWLCFKCHREERHGQRVMLPTLQDGDDND